MISELAFSPRTESLLTNSGSEYLVTGATGWIGRATLEMLSTTLGRQFRSRVHAYGSSAGELRLSNGVTVAVTPLIECLRFRNKRSILFHYAFLTKDKVGDNAELYCAANYNLREMVLELIASSDLQGVVVASSGAVYDYLSCKVRDPSANLYGRLKYEDEHEFSDACAKAGIPIVIPRIFNLSGPYVNKIRSYALSAIICDVLAGGSIKLSAARRVYRSYVFVGDIIEVAVRQLLSYNNPQPIIYDTKGDDVVEVGELANRICDVLGRRSVRIERPAIRESDADRYVGDQMPWTDILRKEEYDLMPLSRQIKSTANYLRELMMVAGDVDRL